MGNEVDDSLLFGNSGEALVIWKNLFASKRKKKEDRRRTNIFYICCTVEKKVYKVIIDGESYEHVISQKAITKLNLAIEKHSQPYKLSWFQKGSEVIVDNHCLVSFSIG